MTGGFRLLLTELFESSDHYGQYDWQSFREGVQIVRFYADGEQGPSAALLRYQPGASVPAHLHPGFEHILILEGAQEDERGRYGRGSLLIHGPGTRHRVASPEGCVALAIWVKPVEIL
jgi:anti-sigma factor ChrR (cupin superfamily)